MIKITTFDTEADESKLKKMVEDLAVNGREIGLDGAPNVYVVTKDRYFNCGKRFRTIKIRGNKIMAADYAMLVMGVLDGARIGYENKEEVISVKEWRRR